MLKTNTRSFNLVKAAKALGIKPLKWIKVIDAYGYDWDFHEEYAVSSFGDLVSFKHNSPTLLCPLENYGYPTASMYTCSENLRISLAQVVKQVWGKENRLPKHYCARKDGFSTNVEITNLQQVKHWSHARKIGRRDWREFRPFGIEHENS